MKVRRKRYGWSLIFLAVTFVLLGIWLIKEYSLHDLWELMQEVRLRWLAAATGLMVVYWLLEAASLHRAIRKVVPTQRLADTLCTTMIGQFFNCITPFSSGGQPMQALHLVKTGVPLSLASCSLMIKFIVYQFILTVYSAVTLLWCFPRMAGRISAIGWLALVGFGVNILVIVGLICLGFFRKPTERFLYGIVKLIRRIGLLTPEQEEAANRRIQKELGQFYQGFVQMRQDLAGIAVMSLLTALQLTAFFLVPTCIFCAFGLGHPDVLLMVCAGAFVLNFTSFVPLPGAAGGAELGFHTVFAMFFPKGFLNLAIILWRLLTFYLPILAGGCFTAFSGLMDQQKVSS